MVSIPEKITQPLDRNTVNSINNRIAQPIDRNSISNINKNNSRPTADSPAQNHPRASQQYRDTFVCPNLLKSVSRGQKTILPITPNNQYYVCFGWVNQDTSVDVDASAFLVTNTNKVPAEDWFVFYGNNISPDNAVKLNSTKTEDKNNFLVNLALLNQHIEKIIFVLTIDEAIRKRQNFSMIKNIYVRVLDSNKKELISYAVAESLSSVSSMTVCELYMNKGQWKFNPVGNGVSQDLAGQCAIYGIETN